MSTDAAERFSVLVDEPRPRSVVPPVVVGATLLVLLVGGQLGLAVVGDEPPTSTAGPEVVTAPTPAMTATVRPEALTAPTVVPAPDASGALAAAVDPRRVQLQQALDAAGPVTFDPVTGEPTEGRTEVLNAVAAAVLEAGDLPVAVVGHPVPSGDPAVDEAAALELAESVSLSLRLRMVPAQLLAPEPAGATDEPPANGVGSVDFRVLPPA